MSTETETVKSKPKQKQDKRLLFAAFVLIMMIVAAIFVPRNQGKPVPNDNGYYSGPMVNKTRTLYVTEDGRIMKPPPYIKLLSKPAPPDNTMRTN